MGPDEAAPQTSCSECTVAHATATAVDGLGKMAVRSHSDGSVEIHAGRSTEADAASAAVDGMGAVATLVQAIFA